MAKPALAGAALLFVLNLLAFTSGLYARFAEQRLEQVPDERASRAAALSAQLAPWSAPALAMDGWIRGNSGDFDAADAAYASALRLAPADALLWTEYALVLGRNRVFDARLELATRRALALAPTSPVVRQGLARMALSYGRFAGPALLELWSGLLREEHARDRTAFLQALEREGYRGTFCAGYAADLGETGWCAVNPS